MREGKTPPASRTNQQAFNPQETSIMTPPEPMVNSTEILDILDTMTNQFDSTEIVNNVEGQFLPNVSVSETDFTQCQEPELSPDYMDSNMNFEYEIAMMISDPCAVDTHSSCGLSRPSLNQQDMNTSCSSYPTQAPSPHSGASTVSSPYSPDGSSYSPTPAPQTFTPSSTFSATSPAPYSCDASAISTRTKPKRRGPGRPKVESMDEDDDYVDLHLHGVEDRKSRRRRQNREAARRCRERKKAQRHNLVKDYYDLVSSNAEKEAEISKLKKELEEVQRTFQAHISRCGNVFLKN